MRVLGTITLLVISLTIPLRADTYEVTKTTIAGHEMVFAFYSQGKNARTEHLSRDGAQFVTIQNLEKNKMYVLDPPSRKYIEQGPQSPDLILFLAQRIARPSRIRESGKTVNIYYETIDTGERKEFFGRTAKHLHLRERHVAEPGACDRTYETEKDGWYIPPTELSTARGHLLFGGSGQCHDTVVKHGDSSPPGLPVLETDGALKREILQLSHEPLDKSLFEVPGDFQKVEALPGQPQPMLWSQRLQMEWNQLERAFESWFE